MNITQLVSCPAGLHAVYTGIYLDPRGEECRFITARPVDALALVNGCEVVGVLLEASLDAQPAPLAVKWFETIYGESLQGARFLGYTRDDIQEVLDSEDGTPENNKRQFWDALSREACRLILVSHAKSS